MLTPDPKNKDESYRYAVETFNHYILKQFSKEEQSAAKRIIQNLLKKGVILRGKTDIGKKTAWILVYVE